MKGSTQLDEELFWHTVETAQGSAEKLKQILLTFSKEEIISFHQHLDEAMYQLDREDIHEITDGSEDGFEYARLWIVSQGRRYFEAVLHDPNFAEEDEENEPFGYAAQEAYEEKWQEPFPHLPNKRATGTNKAGWPG